MSASNTTHYVFHEARSSVLFGFAGCPIQSHAKYGAMDMQGQGVLGQGLQHLGVCQDVVTLSVSQQSGA